MKYYCILTFLIFQMLVLAQDSLSNLRANDAPSASRIERIPKNLHLSQITIKDQFVDFKRLEDINYVNQLEFGEALRQSFDSLVPFYHYPTTLDLC